MRNHAVKARMFNNYLYNIRAYSTSKTTKVSSRLSKVPNVLVMTDDNEVYGNLYNKLISILNPNKHLIYQIKSDSSFRPLPSDTALILGPEPIIDSGKILQFCQSGGCAIVDGQKDWLSGVDSPNLIHCEGSLISLDNESIRKILNKFPTSVFTVDSSSVSLPKVTKARVYCSKEDMLENFLLKGKIQQKALTIEFGEGDSCHATEDYLPIIISKSPTNQFDIKKYRAILKTDKIGRAIIHSEVMRSSFDILEGQFLYDGLAVVVDQQISGRGRSGNKWLSPVGCAMFSLQFQLASNGIMARKISLVQHLVGLAVVRGVAEKYPGIGVKLKWPNDIVTASGAKLGGVVVYTSVFRDKVQINAGVGVNLLNQEPTVCLNMLIKNMGDYHPPLSREEFLAITFNHLENFLKEIEEKSSGLESIIEIYHQHWSHQNQSVMVVSSENGAPMPGIVRRLDDDGFLKVELEDGRCISVHPDGNSFDMMQGLIMPKSIK